MRHSGNAVAGFICKLCVCVQGVVVRASGFFSRRQSIPIFLLTAFLLASTFQILIFLMSTHIAFHFHTSASDKHHTHILYNSSSFTSHSFFRSISKREASQGLEVRLCDSLEPMDASTFAVVSQYIISFGQNSSDEHEAYSDCHE